MADTTLKDARIAKGLKQREVAKLIGTRQQLYCLYENKTHIPGIKRMNKIAEVLGLKKEEVNDFFSK